MLTINSLFHTLCMLSAVHAVYGSNIGGNITISNTVTKVASVRNLKQQLIHDLQPFTHDLGSAETTLHKDSPWVTSISNRTALTTYSEAYFMQLEQASKCRTVFATVTKQTFSKMLSRKLYAFHSNDCWILRGSLKRYKDIYSMKCTQKLDDFRHLDTELNTEIFYHYDFKVGLFDPQNQIKSDSTTGPEQIKVGYVHILRNAFITRYGDVVTDDVYIHVNQCRHFHNKDPQPNIVRYDKVFSISQYWGAAYYHFTNEDLPRLVLALPYLWEHKDIKIHITHLNPFVKAFMWLLGITPDRLITGNIEAKTAYIPAGTVCGRAAIVPINILSIFLRAQLKQEQQRDMIILIKRSTRRWFDHHDEILDMLKIIAESLYLKVEVFGDNPPPSLRDTSYLFNRAVMVVGPHGAGLSNLLFSQPGTCVVEGLCYELNLVYKHLCQALGHVHYGIPKRTCREITADDLAPHIHHCLRWKMKDISNEETTILNTKGVLKQKEEL